MKGIPSFKFFVGHYDNGITALIQPKDFGKENGAWTWTNSKGERLTYKTRAEAMKHHLIYQRATEGQFPRNGQ